MAKSIEDVKGIGPVSAALLKKAGFGTVAKLAAATVARLTAIKGFSEIRSARVVEQAKTLLASDKKQTATAKEPPAKAKAPKPSSGKKKKDEKKKKDKKGDKKKSDKKKAKKKAPGKKKGNKKGKKKK